MLAYQVAAATGQVAGVVGMCFLDQSVQQVADETALNVAMSRRGSTRSSSSRPGPRCQGLRMPMRVASKMHTLVNDRAALKACLRDRTSAGNAMTMTFLDSYIEYRPAVEPEDFDVCPILLTQPGEDRWTPLHLSEIFLSRIGRVPVTHRDPRGCRATTRSSSPAWTRWWMRSRRSSAGSWPSDR